MALDERRVAAALDANAGAIEAYLDDDSDRIARYRDAIERLPTEWTSAEIRAALDEHSYPGAVPTPAFDESESLIVPHRASDAFDHHEDVNAWAREVLQDVPVLAVDGSQLPPTTQFSVPLAYVQSAWALNYHRPEGRLDRDIEGRLLTPDAITRESDEGDYRFVDSQLVGHARFEHEGCVLVDRIAALAAARDAGELDRPPVAIYDGPLIASFANPLAPETRDRYLETLSRVIAASEYHEVPLVGYVADSSATELVKMVRLLEPDRFADDRVVPDAHVLADLTSPWGDRTIPFVSKRDGSVDALETTYRGEAYAFEDDICFSYLDVPPGSALDRIEFPGWLCRADGPAGYETMFEYTVAVVRAEAGVGRGYPEILQQADSDAVLDGADRQQFQRLVGRWAESNDVPLEWTAKARSKELRRR
ncbi:DNA double-strand break repair nuclease NurA [Halococcoides cellulosivorans]|uniref:NurA domain-containing protein n=1 Tax=Halococcoides cellulosivorans TaxID=1679096 RepID=A0A2R4X1A9_9EURY|nr:DNA double-strand break repair nuclease NurA [Halococcoides cellulosivorans]AWB27579.1 NurA domain-containing protein [Halococcoides cellulosivorans]